MNTSDLDKRLTALKENIEGQIISPNDVDLIDALLAENQHHLFADWDLPGVNDRQKVAFIDQLRLAEMSYNGGLKQYLHNARKLLHDAHDQKNPYAGFTPTPPPLIDLTKLDQRYEEYETLALDHLDEMAIIVVAGGLGERLGYPGIKLDIPMQLIDSTSYLKYYIKVIKSLEDRSGNRKQVPLVIMTSQDTHEKTRESLERENYWGLDKSQITILKQELVPALADNQANIALKSKYEIVFKPHGHGDIHGLMHGSGTAQKLFEQGIKYLLFIQDTNGQVFNAAFAALGVSMKHSFALNSIAVNRIPGEAVGALTKLVKEDQELTINVEYNQLEPLLKENISAQDDMPNDQGFSVFPGNVNFLIGNLKSYINVLERSQGVIPEFVNPKYRDSRTRTDFRSPTRLETMMQDLPKLFNKNEIAGVTLFDRKWCFSPNKNKVEDAAKKYRAGAPPESAATAESDFYHTGRVRLSLAYNTLSPAPEELICGVPFVKGPRIILYPSFGITLQDIKSKIKNCSFDPDTTLLVDGDQVYLENVSLLLQSSLLIRACKGARVTVKNLTIENPGHQLRILNESGYKKPDIPEYVKMRGYYFQDCGAAIYTFSEPGNYVIDESGKRLVP